LCEQEEKRELAGEVEQAKARTSYWEKQLETSLKETEFLRQRVRVHQKKQGKLAAKLVREEAKRRNFESQMETCTLHQDERANLVREVECAQADRQKSEQQLERCRKQIHNMQEEKEKEISFLNEEKRELAGKVEQAKARTSNLENQLQTSLKETESLRRRALVYQVCESSFSLFQTFLNKGSYCAMYLR
jgi:chromosome segregation ATPase